MKPTGTLLFKHAVGTPYTLIPLSGLDSPSKRDSNVVNEYREFPSALHLAFPSVHILDNRKAEPAGTREFNMGIILFTEL